LQIQCIERDSEAIRHAASILGIGGTAASLLVVGSLVEDRQLAWGTVFSLCRASGGQGRLFPVPHEDADHIVPLLAEQGSRDTAVDTPGHGKNDARHENGRKQGLVSDLVGLAARKLRHGKTV
jgi:hypothetical protein